jgi:hypothetical protein
MPILRDLKVLFTGVTLSVAACSSPPVVDTHIDEAQARKLVLKSYHELFRNAYARDEKSGTYERYPQLEASDLTYAEYRGDAWLVQADPPAGFMLKARVGKDGSWVEFTSVGFNDW